MLDPKPGRTGPKPSKILSKARLEQAWRGSRDATNNPGVAGVDREKAEMFRLNLNFNLRKIANQLAQGEYGFQKLKAFFIPKANSSKLRVICVPTVRDRLVQRAIVNYLYSNKRIPVRHPFSFGFVKGSGSHAAIDAAIDLRGRFEWCLKTDIESFFDRIPRDELKKRVEQTMRGSSLIPLLTDVIDCEIETRKSPLVQAKLDNQGIKPGMGLRQGMPLSPILSNLLLSNFDRGIRRSGVEMIRYADDLALFFYTQEEAHKGKELVARLLGELKLTIPRIGSPKTQVVGPDDPLHFLGREIVRTPSGKYVAQISRLQIAKITEYLEDEYSLRNCYKLGFNFQKLLTALSASVAAYRGVYRDAFNFMILDQALTAANRRVISNIFADIFKPEALELLDDEEKKFLGFR